jgi:hypothetical protein
MSWRFAFLLRQRLKESLWVVPFLVGTLTFSFWLLRRVESNSVPNIGVTVAGAAAAS